MIEKSLISSSLRAEERINVLYIIYVSILYMSIYYICFSLILFSNIYFINFYFHLPLK